MPDEGQLLTALTTEHFGLAGARSQAAGETSSRSALYLGSVSSTLVGLGLTSQVSKGSDVFHVFALVALPTLFVLGVFTFVRLVELGIEDFLLGRAINRIRHYYLEHAGESGQYFMMSGNDDADGVMANMGLERRPGQLYFTAALEIAVVNAVVGGSAVALGSESRSAPRSDSRSRSARSPRWPRCFRPCGTRRPGEGPGRATRCCSRVGRPTACPHRRPATSPSSAAGD